MCGLIGVIHKENKSLPDDTKTLFKELLYVGALRGFDGTGIFSLNWSNKTEVWKTPFAAGPALYKIHNDKVSLWGKALFGHNRAATKGEKTEQNTHPFKEKHITLMHNGTLFNHKALADTENDSHAICHSLTEKSPEEVIKQLNGAFALIWFNEQEEKLYAVRNKERPLYLINTKEFYFFVSELKMADWILSRNGITIIDYTLIDPLDLYCFDFKNTNNIKYTISKTEPYTYKALTSNTKKNEEIEKTEKQLLDAGITKDKKVIGYIYQREVGQLAQNQWYKHYGIFEDDPSLDFICWSPLDLNQEYVYCKLNGVYTDTKDNIYIHCIEVEVILDEKIINELDTKEIDKPKEKIIYTKNDIPLTEGIVKMVKYMRCNSCHEKFVASKEIVLIPQYKSKIVGGNKEVQEISGYNYYCPECADFFDRADKQWIKRETKHK